jgi:hypothetical protein
LAFVQGDHLFAGPEISGRRHDFTALASAHQIAAAETGNSRVVSKHSGFGRDEGEW